MCVIAVKKERKSVYTFHTPETWFMYVMTVKKEKTLYTFSVTTCEPILRFGEISHHHVSIPYEVGALAYDTPHDSAAKRHDSCMSYIRDMTHVCL